jgi:hypothetical protein
MRQANFIHVINLTHNLIRQVESLSPHLIVAASSVFFLAVCHRFKIRPARVLEITQNMLTYEEARHPRSVGGLRDYLAKEL